MRLAFDRRALRQGHAWKAISIRAKFLRTLRISPPSPWVLDPAVGSISGTVVNDPYHAGTQYNQETGLFGITVYIDGNNNGRLDAGETSAITDANGDYTFPNLSAGSYLVRIIAGGAYGVTMPLGYSASVPVALGQDATAPLFGLTQLSSVWMDFYYLVALARSYGGPGTLANGDLNGDGKVDFTDLVILARNYGHALARAAPASGAAANSRRSADGG